MFARLPDDGTNAVAVAIDGVSVTARAGDSVAAALLGHAWTGGLLVAAGVLLRRSVKTQAPRILLHLSTRVCSVYEAATEHGVMEVRRA
jgi:hypothetical protein